MDRYALFSLTNKTDSEIVAKKLSNLGVKILASSGTGAYLKSKGINFVPVESLTQFPESFNGRMKTLSFQISSGILFNRNLESDKSEASSLKVPQIDYVVCNLYDYNSVAGEAFDITEKIEKIDIGGPNMIRAAAKNFSSVTVLVDHNDYEQFIEDVELDNIDYRKKLAIKALEYVNNYDRSIINDISSKKLRYGENPHQAARLKKSSFKKGIADFKQLQGKQLSYNNYLDMNSAYLTCRSINSIKTTSNTSVVVKHTNPCGISSNTNALKSIEQAWNGDSVSAFGSIICTNYEINENVASFFDDKFIEILMAPKFTESALLKLSSRKNLRLIQTEDIQIPKTISRNILGAELIQDSDEINEEDIDIVTENKKLIEYNDLIQFGIHSCAQLKSNAITLVRQTDGGCFVVGSGMGNPNRLVSIEQSIKKAQENGVKDFSNVILISDAFFPFDDAINLANEYGIKLIVQPGGSIKDNIVVNTCNSFDISMGLTGKRHFNH